MRLAKYIIIYFLLLFAEKNLLYLFSIRHITPDLILIFIIILSLNEKRMQMIIFAFFAGLIQDSFISGFFGLSALTKSIVAFFGIYFQQPKRKYNLAYFIFTFVVLVSIHELVYQFIYALGSHWGFFRLVLYYMIPRTLYTVVFAVLAYLLFRTMLWNTDRVAE
ncbi:MAG: rod shape-determining protein MreD [Candidatus Zhuqueibacterota bacterium]